jgi:hypothetical protein
VALDPDLLARTVDQQHQRVRRCSRTPVHVDATGGPHQRDVGRRDAGVELDAIDPAGVADVVHTLTGSEAERVIAAVAPQQVVACPAGQNIVAAAAAQLVIACLAIDDVIR